MGPMSGRLPVCLCPMVFAALTAAATAQRDPEPATAKLITGRVIDETGRPIAGAAIGVFTSGAFVDTARLLQQPMAATAEDGSYEIAAGEAYAWGEVVVAAGGRQSCAIWIDTPIAAGGGVLGDTLLVPGAVLAGRVRDETGAPLAGVRIRVESGIVDPYGDKARLLAGAATDDEGIFAVPGVPRTGMRMTAMKAGYLTESRLVAQHTPVDLAMQEVGVVRGRVIDAAGQPVAGIHIHARTVETREIEPPVISGPDGAFAITVPKRGRFHVIGGERHLPLRLFRSPLLRGATDGVVLEEQRGDTAGVRTIEVTALDAATGERIPQFHLSQTRADPTNLHHALLDHFRNRRPYDGSARVDVRQQVPLPTVVVVDAPGHGFEVARVPDALDGPLEVKLGPEAVLTGTVIDAETGQPMAGVAVRALPEGTSFGSGGRVEEAGPLTDDRGHYRITGLRPGAYFVQAHAAGRPASEVFAARVEAEREASLDLVVPKERWLELELRGVFSPGPYWLSIGGVSQEHGPRGGRQHSLPWPAPLSVEKAGTFRLGPVDHGTYALQLFAPSRTRAGTGTAIPLGELDRSRQRLSVALPDLKRCLVAGRVVLPQSVPTERVAVLANAAAGAERRFARVDRRNVAGIDAAGGFMLDLPNGTYRLQLADLLTGIVFHTEEQDFAIGEAPPPIEVRPTIRWLEIECAPQEPGGEVVLRSLRVRLPRPHGACGAFLTTLESSDDIESGMVEFRLGGERQRCLVPQARIEIEARGWQGVEVAEAAVVVSLPEQRIVLKVPGPSDEELLRD